MGRHHAWVICPDIHSCFTPCIAYCVVYSMMPLWLIVCLVFLQWLLWHCVQPQPVSGLTQSVQAFW